MKCDHCGREIKVGGTYFLTEDGKKFCERHCYGQVGLHRPVLPIVNIEPTTINVDMVPLKDISGIPTITEVTK